MFKEDQGEITIICFSLQYFELKFKMGDPTLRKGCNSECRKKHLCEMVTTEWENSAECTRLTTSSRPWGK